MAALSKTPYEILGVPENIHHVRLRTYYRQIIHDHKQNKIPPEEFRNKVRAYETLSDFDKRQEYDSNKQWLSHLPLTKYTAQQLAAEPALILVLQDRLRHANLAEINAQDPVTGHTVLYCAARAGNVEAVSFLTEQGAEPDLFQRTKSTALHVASFYGHADIVRCLLENGADYRILNVGNSTAEDEAYNDDVKRVFVELKQTPYVKAAANEIDWFSNNSLVQHIDEEYNAQRQTLLHCSSKKGYYDLVRLFVGKLSANLDIVDVNGNSALHLAAYGGHTEIVEYLLNRGCNSTLDNRWGLTAEQEGSRYGDSITSIFQNMRSQDMFEMARQGVDWWFRYYFDMTSVDATDSSGTCLLYHASRHGQYDVAKWLLEHGANVNIRMKETPRSTSLHGAKFHGHLAIVELLLEYGADVTAKNDFKATVFDESVSDHVDQSVASRINEFLLQYRSNIQKHRLINVHIYLDEDDGNDPKIKIQLHHAAVYIDLLHALPDYLRNEYNHFSIAGRPLEFIKKETTLISAVCCARYVSSRFIDTPLRLTLHKTRPSKSHSARWIRQDPQFRFRSFSKSFQSQCVPATFRLKPSADKQTVNVGNLKFTFSESSMKDEIKFEVKTLFSVDPETFHLSRCICLFETSLFEDTNKLLELPLVSVLDKPNAHLYTLATPSPYWFSSDTRRTRLPMLDGMHAFVIPVTVIPTVLTLPEDIVMAAAFDKPLISREKPVKCSCLVLQEHDSLNFPDVAYHGTNISVIRSILIDGLVVPGTVVSSGKRIRPPSNHIPRGREAFKISDFADAVFLSPSIHYSSDPTYAVAFSFDDQQMLPVLECSVKKNSYSHFSCTVPRYIPHADDNVEAIEWRVLDPQSIVINSVLFIPTISSLKNTTLERITKLTVSSDSR